MRDDRTKPLKTLADIQSAAIAIKGHGDNTPFLHSETLSEIIGAEIWLKFENLQFTGSFEQRGALNNLLSPGSDECKRGVTADLMTGLHRRRQGTGDTRPASFMATLPKPASGHSQAQLQKARPEKG